jgi:hypothetical protein
MGNAIDQDEVFVIQVVNEGGNHPSRAGRVMSWAAAVFLVAWFVWPWFS